MELLVPRDRDATEPGLGHDEGHTAWKPAHGHEAAVKWWSWCCRGAFWWDLLLRCLSALGGGRKLG